MLEEIEQMNLDARLGRAPENMPDFELLEMVISEKGQVSGIYAFPLDNDGAAAFFGEKLVDYYALHHPDKAAYAKDRAGMLSGLSSGDFAAMFMGEMPDDVRFVIRKAGPEEMRADFEEFIECARRKEAENRRPRYAEGIFLGALDLPFRTGKKNTAIAELSECGGSRKTVLVVDGVNGAVIPSPHGISATKVWYDADFRPNSYFEEQSLILKAAMRFRLEFSASVDPRFSREDVARCALLARPLYDEVEFAMTFGDRLAEYRDDLANVCRDNGVKDPENLPLPVLREIDGGFRAAFEPVIEDEIRVLHEEAHQALVPMIDQLEESCAARPAKKAPRP